MAKRPHGTGSLFRRKTGGVWTAMWYDHTGRRRKQSTRTTDRRAAERILSKLVSDAALRRDGVIDPSADTQAEAGKQPLKDHFTDYLAYLRAKTVRGRHVSQAHRENVQRQLERLARDCGLHRLGDITRTKLVAWMNTQRDKGELAPRTVNMHRAAIMAFCRWAVRDGRLPTNPLEGLPGAAEAEARRVRRALSADEVKRLLDAAERRPLAEARTIRTGQNKGKPLANVRDDTCEHLIRVGRERALIYRLMIYTGLRRNEAATLAVGDLHLQDQTPHIALAGKHAKSGQGAKVPLRAELAARLAEHLDDKLAEHRRRTLADGRRSIPMKLPHDMPVFTMPRDFVKLLDKDLAFAGIAKRDGQGRTVDVHSLRHTFATMLSQAGVSPRYAQELLRHSDIRLTMSTYTHLALADTTAEVERLPSIETDADAEADSGADSKTARRTPRPSLLWRERASSSNRRSRGRRKGASAAVRRLGAGGQRQVIARVRS